MDGAQLALLPFRRARDRGSEAPTLSLVAAARAARVASLSPTPFTPWPSSPWPCRPTAGTCWNAASALNVFGGALTYGFIFWGRSMPYSRLTSAGLVWIWGVFFVRLRHPRAPHAAAVWLRRRTPVDRDGASRGRVTDAGLETTRGYDPGVNDRFLRACRREPVDRTPVWFMRQAGRYMPEYRALRAQHSLLSSAARRSSRVEVTLQPMRGPRRGRGHPLQRPPAARWRRWASPSTSQAGEGPRIEQPLRSRGRHRRACGASSRARTSAWCSRPSASCGASSRHGARSSASRARRSPSPPTRSRAATRRNFALTKALMYGDARGLAPPGRAARRRRRATTCARRWRPARRPSSSSTPGSARSTRPTTASSCCPHVARIFDAPARALGVPVIHFGTGTGHLLECSARRAAT